MRTRSSNSIRAAGSGVVLLLAVLCLLGTGCRTTYYSIMETFGQHKRDLLKDSLTEAGEAQEEAAEQFQDALTQLQELTGFDGGELQKRYNAFNSEYESCVEKSERVRSRIRRVETISEDLFEEWEREIEEINNAELRGKSRNQLSDTRARYRQIHASMVRAEQSMEPVVSQMKDYTLYLKHNLNARAIGSLQDEADSIRAEIDALIQQMNQSIRETESFIREIDES